MTTIALIDLLDEQHSLEPTPSRSMKHTPTARAFQTGHSDSFQTQSFGITALILDGRHGRSMQEKLESTHPERRWPLSNHIHWYRLAPSQAGPPPGERIRRHRSAARSQLGSSDSSIAIAWTCSSRIAPAASVGPSSPSVPPERMHIRDQIASLDPSSSSRS